jgi:hypothetical protein
MRTLKAIAHRIPSGETLLLGGPTVTTMPEPKRKPHTKGSIRIFPTFKIITLDKMLFPNALATTPTV